MSQTSTQPPPTHTTPPSPTTTPHLHALRIKGYTIIPAAIPRSLLQVLHTAASDAATLAHRGHWPYLRTLPKQFPPWPSDPSLGIWGVQHLLHPAMPGRDIFARCYFGDEVLEGVKELLEIPRPTPEQDRSGEEGDERLVMELLNLLVTPPADFALRWHRDAIPFSADITPEEETRLLGLTDSPEGKLRRPFHAQYNIPLAPSDNSLIVVPGSHLRPRTEEERRLLAADPYCEDLPGQEVVMLRAGDVAFYDNNIIHRGVYRAEAERLTLHGSVGDVMGGHGRARNVLQHGVGGWIGECGFEAFGEGRLERRAEGMRGRLVELGRETGVEGIRAVLEG